MVERGLVTQEKVAMQVESVGLVVGLSLCFSGVWNASFHHSKGGEVDGGLFGAEEGEWDREGESSVQQYGRERFCVTFALLSTVYLPQLERHAHEKVGAI